MRIITVPIDKEAEKRLEYDQNIESDVIDVFLNESDFEFMFSTPLYNEINDQLNIFIDYAEEECVRGKEDLKKMHSIIVKYEKRINNPIVHTLKSLTEAAIRFDTGVYFFF